MKRAPPRRAGRDRRRSSPASAFGRQHRVEQSAAAAASPPRPATRLGAAAISSSTISVVMRPPGASVAMRRMAPLKSRKLPVQRARATRRSRGSARAPPCSWRRACPSPSRARRQLVIEVRLDVLAPLAQAGQPERPQVDAREQVLAEPPVRGRRPADRRSCRRSAGSRCALRDRRRAAGTASPRCARSSIACSSAPSSPISSRNSTPPSAARSRPGRSRTRAGERAADVAEQRRHRRVAAQRRAIHLDERSRDALARLLQLVDAARELRLARARRPVSSIGAREAIATCSMRSISR